jgi:hypothetical protein
VTESATTKQPYRLRLTDRFFLFQPDRGIHVSREWAQGDIVDAHSDIDLLERYAAPVERVEKSEAAPLDAPLEIIEPLEEDSK